MGDSGRIKALDQSSRYTWQSLVIYLGEEETRPSRFVKVFVCVRFILFHFTVYIAFRLAGISAGDTCMLTKLFAQRFCDFIGWLSVVTG